MCVIQEGSVLALGLSVAIIIGVTIIGFRIHRLAFFSILVPTGTPLGLVVRQSGGFIASIILIHYFTVDTAIELGPWESHELNIASQSKADGWLNQLSSDLPQAVLPM